MMEIGCVRHRWCIIFSRNRSFSFHVPPANTRWYMAQLIMASSCQWCDTTQPATQVPRDSDQQARRHGLVHLCEACTAASDQAPLWSPTMVAAFVVLKNNYHHATEIAINVHT